MALVPADLFFEQIQLTVLENYFLVLFARVSVAIIELNQLMEGLIIARATGREGRSSTCALPAAECWISSATSCNSIQRAAFMNATLATTFNIPFHLYQEKKAFLRLCPAKKKSQE